MGARTSNCPAPASLSRDSPLDRLPMPPGPVMTTMWSRTTDSTAAQYSGGCTKWSAKSLSSSSGISPGRAFRIGPLGDCHPDEDPMTLPGAVTEPLMVMCVTWSQRVKAPASCSPSCLPASSSGSGPRGGLAADALPDAGASSRASAGAAFSGDGAFSPGASAGACSSGPAAPPDLAGRIRGGGLRGGRDRLRCVRQLLVLAHHDWP